MLGILVETDTGRTPAPRPGDTPHRRRSDPYSPLKSEAPLIHGPIGTGKNTALGQHLATQDLPITWIDLPPAYSPKDLIRWLFDDITGHPDDLPTRDLQDDLVEALTAARRIVVIRHVERLTKEAGGQLQWLHDRPGARWALFLIGGPGALDAATRDGLLCDAIAQNTHIPTMNTADVLRVIPGIHDLLQYADRELLAEIDDRVCHVLLSRWARFLHIAIALRDQATAAGRDTTVLDRTLAKATIGQMPTLTRKNKP